GHVPGSLDGNIFITLISDVEVPEASAVSLLGLGFAVWAWLESGSEGPVYDPFTTKSIRADWTDARSPGNSPAENRTRNRKARSGWKPLKRFCLVWWRKLTPLKRGVNESGLGSWKVLSCARLGR